MTRGTQFILPHEKEGVRVKAEEEQNSVFPLTLLHMTEQESDFK